MNKAQKSEEEQNPFTTTDYNKHFNPFSQGSLIKNILWMGCKPGSQYSYMEFNKFAYEDAREQNHHYESEFNSERDH